MKKNLPDSKKIARYKKELEKFNFQPTISILFSIRQEEISLSRQTIESIRAQVYEKWELCISANAETRDDVKALISSLDADSRIKLLPANTMDNVPALLNQALEAATSPYAAIIKAGDLLVADSLFQVVKLLNTENDVDIIYSDDDKISESGEFYDPHFKPDWSPVNLLSGNYTGDLMVMKTELIKNAGGWRKEFDLVCEYDLLLRITELAKKIRHISTVLYHTREKNAKNTKELSAQGIKALEETLVRRGLKGLVSSDPHEPGIYTIRYTIDKPGKVSIIIPTKDKHELCEVILSSVFRLTDYPDFEVIMVSNNSSDPDFFAMVKKWETQEPERFTCIYDNDYFNFSRLINKGASVAKGKYLLLLNNDMEIIHKDWMTGMVEQAQFESTGVVGARLLYPNDMIQHAGVIIGLGALAGHVFVGLDKNAGGYFNLVKTTGNYSAVTAACMMVKKTDFDAVKGFDELFAVEYNDIDFCLKIKDRGLNNIYLPHVTLYHFESISRGHPKHNSKSYKQHLSDVGNFQQKWKKYIDHDPFYNQHLTRIFLDYRLRVSD